MNFQTKSFSVPQEAISIATKAVSSVLFLISNGSISQILRPNVHQ